MRKMRKKQGKKTPKLVVSLSPLLPLGNKKIAEVKLKPSLVSQSVKSVHKRK
jgi:hypothetical protein